MQNTNYQTEPSISNLPSREGQGVCHVRAQPPKTKTNTRNQQTAPQKNTSSQTSPLTVTHPFIPSQEGKQTQQSTNYQTESSISNLPSREGSGVCDARA